ncbi:MAG: immunoglobulin domain-containing protein [Verrucomicrobiales bacterium]|nr:immunoglobulin domain-containing protein [Verrucomicrobiales bacterium]
MAGFSLAVQALAMQPVVAIHDSEFTRALESQPASGATPTGSGTTGFQWWPNNWHYFVMPESVEEALRSDGTAFQVVSDANICAGQLVVNGAPQYPIVISLATEATDNSEIGPLTNYVASGGVLLVGSSAFTRNTNGTTRGDFAFANALGVHMVTAGLNNWGTDSTFTKVTNHAIVTHIPSGTLNWYMPLSAEDIPLGTSPSHPVNHNHLVWQVQAGDATVVANGNTYPYLLVKPFGKGYFIYHAAMQPLIGHSGWDSGTYAYLVFRKAIEWAFANANQPVPRLSPWPYSYNAAAMFRHDMEDIEDLITNIESSAHAEAIVGAKGDYYFCTGVMRVNFSQESRTNNIASLQRAISLYGATIGPHNGGLTNAGNLNLATNTYDYWHWGPDEVLNLTNPPPAGYASGTAYALTSISNAFVDLQKWGATNSAGLRVWASPYFNSTREGSKKILQQLGVVTVGEEKLGPFPHWTLSTETSGKRYPMVSLPVSDWYYGSTVAQSLENYFGNFAAEAAAVDFYYGLGGLIDLYSHSSSAGGPSVAYPDGLGGIAIQSEPAGQQYSVNYTMAKPQLWSVNATSLYEWWVQRSNIQFSATTGTVGNRLATTISIQGATQTNTAVEFLLTSSVATNFQVLENGVLVGTNNYRTNGLVLKCLVGTAVTNVQILYLSTFVPFAQNDAYGIQPGVPLTVVAPGVLANDSPGNGTNLTAALVSGPIHSSAFNLNTNGSFSYTSTPGYSGTDSFTYLVNDGVTNSSSATVTLTVAALPALLSEPASLTNIPGTTANFSVVATSSVPVTYLWFKDGSLLADGGNVAGSSSSNLVLSSVAATDAAQYTVVVANSSGSVTSAPAILTVLSPPVITSAPASQTVTNGALVSFSVTAAGSAPLAYRWVYNGTNLTDGSQYAGSASATLFVTNAQPGNAGNYAVVVTNTLGAVTSSVAILTVTTPGSCQTAPTGLIGWWPGDGNANDIAFARNGTLTGGATANAVGEVGQAFNFDGTNNYVSIPNSTALQPTNLTVECWVKFKSLNSSQSSNPGHQYIVFKQNTRTTDFEGFGLGKNRYTNMTNTAGDVFYFNASSATAVSAEVNSTILIATNIWYHIAGVRGPNFIQLYVNGQLQGQVSVNFAQNYGTNSLYFGTSGQSYWDGKLAGQLDEVSLYDRALSSNEIFATYSAGSAGKCKLPPLITSQPASRAVTVSNSVNFTVGVSGNLFTTYQWRFNGTNIANANTNTYTLANVQPANAGNYTVIVSNAAGSVTSAPAVLTVNFPPVITNQPASLSIIVGNNATFTVGVTGDAPLSYQWYFNTTNAVGPNANSLTLPGVQTNDAGSYTVVITNISDTVTSAPAVLTVNFPPGYGQILGQLLSGGDVRLSFAGVAGGTYALDRSFNLSPPDWLPLLTNTTDANGLIFFTNTPDSSTNNFWRIRSVP